MIALVIWFGGQGLVHDYRPTWDDCQKAADAMNRVRVEASCHMIDLHGGGK